MSRMQNYLDENKRSNVKGKVEKRSLFDIIGGFFSDISSFGKYVMNAKKKKNEYNKKVDSLADADGMLDIADANRLLDEYLDGLIKLAKNSGMHSAMVSIAVKHLESERKYWK